MPSSWESDVVNQKKKPCPCGKGFVVVNEVRYSHNKVPRVEYKTTYHIDCTDCSKVYQVDDLTGHLQRIEDVRKAEEFRKEFCDAEEKVKERFFKEHLASIIEHYNDKPMNAIWKVWDKYNVSGESVTTSRNDYKRLGLRRYLETKLNLRKIEALVDELYINDPELEKLIQVAEDAQKRYFGFNF